jgi:YedE family putative selenium metabolism protein
MMLRQELTPKRFALAISLCAAVGALAALLVLLGNPGNMGLCGACFLRDIAGSLGLFAAGPQIFRPEVCGLIAGALLWQWQRGQLHARSGSYASARLFLGVWMGIAALVFLGCPFRMLQRLGGGDLNAWLALPGFILGVGIGRALEQRGYNVGKTSEVPLPVGLLGPLFFALVLGAFAIGSVLRGPGLGDPGGPAHAHWLIALALALPAGAILSLTGFCAISAARQLFGGPRPISLAALFLIGAYAVVLWIGGKFHLSFDQQPIAHSEWLWNTLSLALLGLCGALAGGCPVRQIVLTGEGNGDAFVTTMGIMVGGAVAHGIGLSSSPAGTTSAGCYAVALGLVLATAYGWLMTRAPRSAT